MSQTESKWRFEVRDRNGTNWVRLSNITGRKVSIGLNQAGEAEFEIDLNDSKAVKGNLLVGRNVLRVYRENVLWFAGKIMIAERYFETSRQYARVKALGFFFELSKRNVGMDSVLTYNQDAGRTLMDLIDLTQNETYGDLGFTEGTIQTSQVIEVEYERQNLAEAIEDLVSQAGIEFAITSEKSVNVYYPLRGSDRSDSVVFKYPGSIASLRAVEDATTIVNKEYALGKGIGSQEVTAERDDVGSQSVYGLYEKVASYKAINNVTTLGNMAEYDVALLKAPRLTLDIQANGNLENPSLDDFGLGDSIRIKIDHPNYQTNQIFRVFEIHVNIQENDKENIRLIVALL